MSKQYYTVKEIADLLNVSKSTVARAIKSVSITPDHVNRKQTHCYSNEKVRLVIERLDPEFDLSVVGADPDRRRPHQTAPHEAVQTASDRIKPPQAESTASDQPLQAASDRIKPPQTASGDRSSTEIIEKTIELLQKQLEAKDKQIEAYQNQIEAKDKQIEDYSKRLQEALDLTKGQQYITATEKTKELIGSEEEKKENNKSIFSLLFNRKRR